MECFNSTKKTVHPIATSLGEIIGYWGGTFLVAVPIFYGYQWVAYNFNLPEATYLECFCLYCLWRSFWSPIKFLSTKD